jgi:hypothetical protein
MAVKFEMQEWIDKYYEDTGEAGLWYGRLYTGKFLRWCLQHLSKEMLKERASTNTAMLQLLSECKPFMALRNGSDEESTKFTSVIGRINAVLAQ